MSTQEIFDEIKEGKNLDVHVTSTDKFVRREVAKNGYHLDVLVNDPSEEVRAAVAAKGYGLTKLQEDKSEWVRYAALDYIDRHSKHNAGYDIISRMDIDNEHYVLAYNPNAPAPFVTWAYAPFNASYSYGHYFTDKDAATLDLIKRSTESQELDGQSIGRALLTEEDRQMLHSEYREENAYEDIAYAVEEAISKSDSKWNMDAILKDSHFMARAVNAYYKLDHSYENEALEQSVSEILRDFPQYEQGRGGAIIIENTTPEIRLAPEEVVLYNDLLYLPADEIVAKYGPMADDIDLAFELGPKLNGFLSLRQNADEDAHPYTIALFVLHDGCPILEIDPKESGMTIQGKQGFNLNGKYIQLSVIEDEALRRVGNSFVFSATSEDKRYTEHNGEVCTIQRSLTVEEADLLQTGLVWEAKFPNGDILHVFDDELTLPEQTQTKLPLDQQIKSASGRLNEQLPADTKEQER